MDNITVGAVYDAEIIINYTDGTTGTARVEDTYVVNKQDTDAKLPFNGIYMPDWRENHQSVKGRSVLDVTYDTENYKTGTGSAKLDYRGYVDVADGKLKTGTVGNTYVRFTKAAYITQTGTYAIEVIVKGKKQAYMSGTWTSKTLADGAGGEANIVWEELGDDWWKMKRVVEVSQAMTFTCGMNFEGDGAKVIYLDSIALKPCTYDATNKTYTVTGENVLGNTNFSYDVVNAKINRTTGEITWTEVDASALNKIYICDGETEVEVEPNVCTYQGDAGKNYTIKTRTQQDANNVSSVLTAGVEVTDKEAIEVPDDAWTAPTATNVMAVGTDLGDPQGNNPLIAGTTNPQDANDNDGVIDVVWDMPSADGKIVDSVTVKLYNEGEATPVTTKHVPAAAGAKNKVASFKELDNTKFYDVEIDIIYADATGGRYRVEKVQADSHQNFDGMYVGTWDLWTGPNKNFHELITLDYDTENYKTGNGSLKLQYRGILNNTTDAWVGVYNTGSITGGNLFARVINTVPVTVGNYYLAEITYKTNINNTDVLKWMTGTNDGAKGWVQPIAGAAEGKKYVETTEDGWTTRKYVAKANATQYWAGLLLESLDGTVYIDSYTLKEIDEYNTDGSYTLAEGAKDLLTNGGVQVEVENAAIIKNGDGGATITFTHPYPDTVDAYVLCTEDGTPIAGYETEAFSMNVSNADNSYMIRVRTKSGGDIATELTPGVAVVPFVEVTVPDDGWTGAVAENVMAVGTDWGDRQNNVADNNNNDGAIDVIWDMPQTSEEINIVKVKLIADTEQDSKETLVRAKAGSKNNVASFTDLNNEAVYDVQISILYENSTGSKYIVENVQADSHQSFDGRYIGNWELWTGPTADYRELATLEYDTETYKTGTGSLKLNYRGNVKIADNSFTKPPVGNALAMAVQKVEVPVGKKYLAEITYKTELDDVKFITGKRADATKDWVLPIQGAEDEENFVETVGADGWKTRKYIIDANEASEENASVAICWVGLITEYSAGEVWLDSYTLKEIGEYNTDGSYTLAEGATDLVVNGIVQLEVEDAYITDYGDGTGGEITFTHSYPQSVEKYILCDANGTPIEDQENDNDSTVFYVEDATADYIIKVKTKMTTAEGTDKIAAVLSDGALVTVKDDTTEPDPDEPDEPEPIETALTLTRDGNSATAKFVTEDYTNIPKAVLIFAEYLGNRMLGMSFVEDTAITAEGAELEITNNELTTGTTVKAMVFDSFKTLRPIIKCETR